MTTIRKKLIEVSLPLEAINAASAREKSIRHGHPSTLHLWWARRPLAACRAVLFAQLVDDPSSWPERFPTEEVRDKERRRLHKIIEDMVPWEASNDALIISNARWEIARSVAWNLGEEPPTKDDAEAVLSYLHAKAPPIYDPFSGGGSIPLEAQRLGLRAYGADLNPVAVLIGKALVEIPPAFARLSPVNPDAQDTLRRGGRWNAKGAQGLAEDVRFYGRWMRNEAERRIGHIYPKANLAGGEEATTIAWLWARTVRSPDPAVRGAKVPLVSSFMLSTRSEKKTWVEPIIDPNSPDGWRFVVRTGVLTDDEETRLKAGTVNRSGGTCILSATPIPFTYIRSEAKKGGLGERLMAVVVDGSAGRQYLDPTAEHENAARLPMPGRPPEGEISPWPGRMNVIEYGMTSFADMFTPRQMAALLCFSDLVGEVHSIVEQQALNAGLELGKPLAEGGHGATAYADAITTYLAFAISKSSTRSCSLAIWESGMGRLAGALGRQSFPMQWSFAETNPLAGAGGDIAGTAASVAENLDNLNSSWRGHIISRAAQLGPSIQNVIISTDPPYYDNIGYSDLSDFFYVWLKLSLSKIWPELFRRLVTPKDEELVAQPFRHGGRENAEAFFMDGMSHALAATASAMEHTTPATIFYAFKQSDRIGDGVTSTGWATFLEAVVRSGYVIDGTWPIRTEATNSLKASMNALASSIVLVCRRRSSNSTTIMRSDFVRELKRELPPAVDAIRKAGVGPVDMQQSIIGPGMGVYSRYEKVLEDDDSPMAVKTALAIINRVWEELENELDGAFDPETQVAITWYSSFGFAAQASGELITLTTAKNTFDRALFQSGVFEDRRGKVALRARESLSNDWTPATDKHPTIWLHVQHVARTLNAEDGGIEAAAALVEQMGSRSSDARKLAYRLFEIATQKGWSSEALVYNELAEVWPKLEDLAASGNLRSAAGRDQGRLALG